METFVNKTCKDSFNMQLKKKNAGTEGRIGKSLTAEKYGVNQTIFGCLKTTKKKEN